MPSKDKFIIQNVMLKYLPLIGLIFLFSCVSGGCKRDRDLIPENLLIDVLADLHITEGVLSSRSFTLNHQRSDTLDFYGPVFRRHGVTRSQFENTIRWYSSRPTEFDKVYEAVIEKISRQSAEVDELIAEEARDAVGNLWNQKTRWKFPEDQEDRIGVDIPVDKPGTYTFTAQIRISPDDSAKDPSVTLWFWRQDSTGTEFRDSFPILQLARDGKIHAYSVSRVLQDTLMTHIKGWILDYSNPDSTTRRHADVLRIRLFIEEDVVPVVDSLYIPGETFDIQ